MDEAADRVQEATEVETEDHLALNDSVSITMLHHLWLDWLDIALANEADARAARERGIAANELSASGALQNELQGALVAISSTAFALEAFTNCITEQLGVRIPPEVKTEIQDRHRGRFPRFERVLAAVEAAFNVEDRMPQWREPIERLFRLRNGAVHYRADWGEPVLHPSGLTQSAKVYAVYDVDTARRLIDLLLDVLTHSFEHPRHEHEAARQFVGREAPGLLERFAAIRAARPVS